jgi:hypothetical protein
VQTVVNMSVTGCGGYSLLDRGMLCVKTKAAPHLSGSLSAQQQRTGIAIAFIAMPAYASAWSHVLCPTTICPLCAQRCRQLTEQGGADSPCCSIITGTERGDRRSVDGGGVRVMGLMVVVVGGLS